MPSAPKAPVESRQAADGLVLVNFSHPLSPANASRAAELAGLPVARVIEVASHIDRSQPLGPQVEQMVDAAGLSAAEWQLAPIAVVVPGLSASAACVIAVLHGRMGHFPAIVRLTEAPGTVATTYEVAELIGLQQLRERARRTRFPGDGSRPETSSPNRGPG